MRSQALNLTKKGDYGNAIAQYARIINDGKATALDYSTLALLILTKQYGKAIKFLKEGEKLDDTELLSET